MNDKNIGSLEVGKLADFIVIDKDYFTIPEDHGVAAECGVAGKQGPGAADMAAGRTASAAKSKAPKTIVAARRFLRAARPVSPLV